MIQATLWDYLAKFLTIHFMKFFEVGTIAVLIIKSQGNYFKGGQH
jgi:hypothetical protein